MLSENLTEDTIRETTISTRAIGNMFTMLANQGYSSMNLKLVIDLLEQAQEES